jgi:hypothetical protein
MQAAGHICARRRTRWTLAKTVYRFSIRLKHLKEPVYSRNFQRLSCPGGDCRKLDIAIALHGFFQAAKQKVDGRSVHPAYPRTIEHNAGAIDT